MPPGQAGFHSLGQVFFQIFLFIIAVQQEGAALPDLLDHVIFVQVHRVMAGHKVGAVDQVGTADGAFAKAQMGDGEAPGFLGIIFKVSLGGHVRVIAYDLDGVLGGADSAVPSQAPEFAGDNVVRGCDGKGGQFQGQVGDIVLNAQGKG